MAEEIKNGGQEQQPEVEKTDDKTDKKEQQPEKTDNNEKKYSDADVDALINKKFAEWSKKRDAEVNEAKKLAEMSETEKSQYERDKLQKQLDELMAEKELNAMTKTARGILADSGITVSDELLSIMVTTDAEKTKAAVDSFIKLFNETVENTVKERLKGKPPRGGKAAAKSKEEIMNVKDTAERQRLILENKELFNL